MSFAKVFRNALGRTLDAAKNNTTAMLRMDVDPTAATRGSLPLWQIKRQEDLADFAVGCDKDMGGLSSMKIDLAQGSPGKKTIYAPKASSESLFGDSSGESEKLDDSQQAPPTPSFEPEPTHHARFFGTLSSQVPRGAGLERSGYAAFRNKVSMEDDLYRQSALCRHSDTTLPQLAGSPDTLWITNMGCFPLLLPSLSRTQQCSSPFISRCRSFPHPISHRYSRRI